MVHLPPLDVQTTYAVVAVYHEARSEPTKCQQLVMDVIKNRMTENDQSVSQVLRSKRQFAWNAVLKNKAVKTEYQRIGMKAKNEDATALQAIITLAKSHKLDSYKPKTANNFFHDKSISKKHPIAQTCGNLVFYRREKPENNG